MQRPVFSARWIRIAPDSNTETGPSGSSSSTIAGMRLFGLIPSNSGLAVCSGKAGAVADQTAGRDKIAPSVGRWDCVPRGKRDELVSHTDKKRVRTDHQTAQPLPHELGKGWLQIALGGSFQDAQSQ